MKYNLYKYRQNEKSISKTDIEINEDLEKRLEKFQNEIVRLYEDKQYGRKGIKSLGDEIRYSKVISTEVFVKNKEYELIKITGNRKTFLKDFLSTMSNNKTSKKLYFLIYESHFRKNSSIVDGTSTTLKDFIGDLNLLNTSFENLSFFQEIYILEICGIDNYYFKKDNEGFTKIFKSNA